MIKLRQKVKRRWRDAYNDQGVCRKMFAFMLTGSVLAFDQVSKWWILTQLVKPPEAIIVTPFLNVVLILNRGISFGLFNNDSPYNSYVLILLTGIFVLVLLAWLLYAPTMLVRSGLCVIIGGATGNALDRLRHDGVVDFLDFHLGKLHWPAFNVADSAIAIGAMVLVADALFNSHSLHKTNRNKS